jgi:hypothetical protein
MKTAEQKSIKHGHFLIMHPQNPGKTRDTVQSALRARIGASKKPTKHRYFLHVREPYPQYLSNSVKCKILYLTQRVDHSLTLSHTLTRFCGYGPRRRPFGARAHGWCA